MAKSDDLSRAQRPRLADVVTSLDRRRAYEEAGIWDDTTLAGRLEEQASANPEGVAVVDRNGERAHDFRELCRDASRVANYLLDRGVEPGDVVGVQLPNWYETVAVDIGALRVGAVVNPMLPLYRGKELRHMLSVGGTKVMFTPGSYRGHDFRDMIQQIRGDLPALQEHVVVGSDDDDETFAEWLEPFSTQVDAPLPVAGAVSELIFTSGTEAAPKAIMHTEQTTNSAVRALWASLGMSDADVVWMPSPIGHSTGFNYGLRAAVYNGVPLVLQDRWTADGALDLIARFGCSYTLAATTFLSDVVTAAQRLQADVSSLRLFGSGGAPVPAPLVEAAAALGISVLRLYGSTELLSVTWNRPDSAAAKKIYTDGRAVDGVEIDVRSEGGVSLRNEPGEIFARGPSTCVGFFNDPARTAATFEPDGWVRSGDLGVLDDDGYLAIVGRKKEIIIRGGLNIAPREIEDMIVQLPQVAAVAVVGLPHERLGELTCACVVLREGQQIVLREVIEALGAEGLATYKLPQALVWVDALPMTSTGKVQKHELVSAIGAGAYAVEFGP